MDAVVKPAPREIRQARANNPKMRERDLAAELGISEAEFVAAFVGEGVTRIAPRVNDVLTGLEAVGEVMALTRNESAVHEKIGVYDKVVTGNYNAMILGEQIDLRIFRKSGATGSRSKGAMETTSGTACNSSTRSAKPSTRCISGLPQIFTPTRSWSLTWYPTTRRLWSGQSPSTPRMTKTRREPPPMWTICATAGAG
jgi:Haemin-degrading HemS.ChuX domain